MRPMFIFFLIFGSAAYANIPAFSLPSSAYSFDQIKPEEAQNMPRIASQDGLGICYACVAATMMQSENCRLTKPKGGCENLPPKELFSQLDLTRIVPPEQGGQISGARSAYEGLKWDSEGDGGGDPHATAIIASLYTKKVANEACLALDTIVNKMTSRGESTSAQEAMWARIKRHYFAIKNSKNCRTCESDAYATAKEDIEKNLTLNLSNQELLEAFSAESYDKFLDQLTGASKCMSTEQSAFFQPYKRVVYEQYPKELETDRKRFESQFIEKTREVLQKGRPLALTGICLGEEDANNCKPNNRHASIIAGFRRVCDKRNEREPGAKCRNLLKIVNCWGKSWQNENNDGWIDAETLMKHTKMQRGMLGFFTDKKVE